MWEFDVPIGGLHSITFHSHPTLQMIRMRTNKSKIWTLNTILWISTKCLRPHFIVGHVKQFWEETKGKKLRNHTNDWGHSNKNEGNWNCATLQFLMTSSGYGFMQREYYVDYKIKKGTPSVKANHTLLSPKSSWWHLLIFRMC